MRLRVVLAALAAALGGWAIALAAWKPGELTLPLPVHLAIGWSFAAAGFVASARGPENRTGLLMMLTGIVWFGRDFDSFGFSTATRLSELSQNLFLALLAHQVVVFPDGVTRSRRERVLVAAIYVLAVPGYAISQIGPTVNAALSAMGIVLAVAAVFVVVDRWRKASAPRRRALEPLLWAGPPVLAVVVASIVKDYLDVSVSATGTGPNWCALAYTLIPVAFLPASCARACIAVHCELSRELSDATPAGARMRSQELSATRHSSSRFGFRSEADMSIRRESRSTFRRIVPLPSSTESPHSSMTRRCSRTPSSCTQRAQRPGSRSRMLGCKRSCAPSSTNRRPYRSLSQSSPHANWRCSRRWPRVSRWK
jgi:hypothetical protein